MRDLLTGTKRFGELRRSLVAVSPRTLTQRLKELEDAGVLKRTIYAEIPPRVEYALTDKGRSLSPILDQMSAWGAEHDEHPQQ